MFAYSRHSPVLSSRGFCILSLLVVLSVLTALSVPASAVASEDMLFGVSDDHHHYHDQHAHSHRRRLLQTVPTTLVNVRFSNREVGFRAQIHRVPSDRLFTAFSTPNYDRVAGALGMNGGPISLVLSVGGQNVQLYLSNIQDTAIGTNDLYTNGYTPGDSSTALLANVCSSTPCVATFNASSADLFGPYGFSGPVYQDAVILGYTDGTNVNVTNGRFVAASSKSGTAWALGNNPLEIPPLTLNVGQFGIPVNTTACYGSTCFTGVYGTILDTYSLDNIVGICSNFSIGSIVTLGGPDTNLYTGSITYAATASSSTFGIDVATGYEDAIVVTGIVINGNDMTSASGQTAIGDYTIVEVDSPYLLFQPSVYLEILATLVNAINPTKSVTASTPNLEDIFVLEVVSNITSLEQYYALPPIVLTVRLDGTTSTNISIPVHAYLPAYDSWELPLETINIISLINTTVNFQSVTGNNTVLGLPFFYSNYTVLDRANERIGLAAPVNSCSIGCLSLSTQVVCSAEPNCAWCYDPLINRGLCVEATAYGAAAPTANSEFVCPPVATTTGGGGGNAAFSTAGPLGIMGWTGLILLSLACINFIF